MNPAVHCFYFSYFISSGLPIQLQLSELNGKLKRVAENMALADNDSQRQAMKGVFEDLRKQHAQLSSEMQTLKTKANTSTNVSLEVEAAMQSFKVLDELVNEASNLAAMGECIKALNVKLFLRFAPERSGSGKRMLNKLVSGVLTTGLEPLPITPYEGPTGRRSVKEMVAKSAKSCALTGSAPENGNEVVLLGNVNRGDRTPIELFIQGTARLETQIQRLIAAA